MKSKLVLALLSILLLGGGWAVLRTASSTPTPVAADPQVPDADLGALETQVDEQGAVAVAVTPLNLDSAGAALGFEVSLNTHSVDLSMDLAELATLTTDTGLTVAAIEWQAPRGGHHVSGNLIFPAQVDGAYILAGAGQITLTIRGVDAAERVFNWSLPPGQG